MWWWMLDSNTPTWMMVWFYISNLGFLAIVIYWLISTRKYVKEIEAIEKEVEDKDDKK